jgi:hypothetical protein
MRREQEVAYPNRREQPERQEQAGTGRNQQKLPRQSKNRKDPISTYVNENTEPNMNGQAETGGRDIRKRKKQIGIGLNRQEQTDIGRNTNKQKQAETGRNKQ